MQDSNNIVAGTSLAQALNLVQQAIGAMGAGDNAAVKQLVAAARLALPKDAIAPSLLASVVVGAAVIAFAMATPGLRFDLSARRHQHFTRERLREVASVALEGLIICDGETVMTVNKSFGRLCGSEEALLNNGRWAPSSAASASPTWVRKRSMTVR